MGVMAWLLLVVGVLGMWAYSRWRHSYWAARGLPTPPYLPILGHVHKIYSVFQGRWLYMNEVYLKHGGATFCGLYELFRPVLVVGDPDILKNIFIKDFDHFVDRRKFLADDKSLMNEMLGNKSGSEWKELRSVMTPTFTSGKMRGMFPLICQKADTLVSFCLKQASENPHINIKHNFGCFSMDTLASCAFGIECNSLVNEKGEFIQAAKSFFSMTYFRLIKFIISNVYPKLFSALRLTMDGPAIKYFTKVAMETKAAREAGHRRGDFLDLLLETRENEKSLINGNDHTTHDEDYNTFIQPALNQPVTLNQPNVSKKVLQDRTIVAQCVMFLMVGYDSTANALGFSSFLLAKNPAQQHRLRRELQQMKEQHGDITYQGIMEAKFLDACLMEALRLYSPAPVIERLCTKTYQLAGTDVTLHAGDVVMVPVWSLHHDPRYWPHPEEFLPERFLPENRSSITPCTHLPFGVGPRNCIAMRFALMEAKVALAKLLLAAELRLAEGHDQLELEASPFILRPKSGVNLVLSPLTH